MRENEKTAIVGVNGAGKTTLLRILTGETVPDAGQVVGKAGMRMAYLTQHQSFAPGKSIYRTVFETDQKLLSLEKEMTEAQEELTRLSAGQAAEEELSAKMEQYARLQEAFERAGGYAYRSEVTGVLKGLGFKEEQFGDAPETLSGGLKTRLSLACILLEKPDLLLLDEPTNHLDIPSIEWLENYLRSYKGGLLLVSHDRYFLNRIVSRVIEIEQGTILEYTGNYDAFAEKKAELRKAQRNAYLADQRKIRHEEEVIATLRRYGREKQIKRAESRVKLLAKMKPAEKPVTENAEVRFRLKSGKESGQDVLTVEGLSKAFGTNRLFEDASLLIKKHDRVVLIGENGTGKSTFLKIIADAVPADEGTVRIGANVHIGYYDQENQKLTMENTVFEEISDAFPDLSNTQIRSMLARFLFMGEDVFKRIGDLSGGERARVALAKLMLGEANFLLLDEPTNHLDMHGRAALEEALCAYEGTVLCVSHDRYFANRVATRILELDGLRMTMYSGNYTEAMEEKQRMLSHMQEAVQGQTEKASEEKPSSSRNDWMEAKQKEAERRKKENAAARIEKEIAKLEEEIGSISDSMADPDVAADHARLMELFEEKKQKEERIETLFAEWETL